MGDTSIEWTEKTWNPVTGCDRISPGCAHCYAKSIHDRRHKAALSGKKMPLQFLQPFEVVTCREDRLDAPRRWRTPKRVFVNSMSDLFHESVPDDFLHRVYHVMEHAGQHTFQILTKRAERMCAYLEWRYGPDADAPRGRIPSRHIWHGVSAENQHFADERIPWLLRTRSAVRFVSLEPLLGPINLRVLVTAAFDGRLDALSGTPKLDWIIVGGESGHGARPVHVAWIRAIVRQCRAARVSCFVKQIGANVQDRNDAGFEGDPGDSWTPETRYDELTAQGWQGDPVRIRLRDRKGGNPEEWPSDLRVRQYPEARA